MVGKGRRGPKAKPRPTEELVQSIPDRVVVWVEGDMECGSCGVSWCASVEEIENVPRMMGFQCPSCLRHSAKWISVRTACPAPTSTKERSA